MKQTEAPQRTPYILISAILAGFTVYQMNSSSAYFQKYFGRINPVLVLTIAVAIGGVLLAFLSRTAGFRIASGRKTVKGIGVSAGLATLMGIAIVVFDSFHPYPADTNVPVPQAFFFYPVMGFVVEVGFHLFPLAFLLLVFYPLRQIVRKETILRIAILVTAASEPTFQILFTGEPITWTEAYTWIHIFIISILQLSIFRRYDFVSMYAFRIVYYAHWHIIWGVIRLSILF